MCNACGFLCCASDEFEGGGCACPHPGCQYEPCECAAANCQSEYADAQAEPSTCDTTKDAGNSARRLERGDKVRVHPSAGRGCSYLARVDMVTLTGPKVRIKPIGAALTQPAWCSSTRARWVSITKVELVAENA